MIGRSESFVELYGSFFLLRLPAHGCPIRIKSGKVGLIVLALLAVGMGSGVVSKAATPRGPMQNAPAQDEAATEERQAPPPLSLETLFHPQKKFDFDGDLPATHWIEDSSSKLLIRRETWNEVNLETGDESPWPVVEDLARQLQGLAGLKAGQGKSAAMNAVPKMKSSDDSVLVQFGKSLAIVSRRLPARWLTRDCSGWKNTTLGPQAKRVAYTRDGDLFVLDVTTGRLLRLTNDGTDTILDGILDWTYQEEIFGRGNYRGFWFSPDGQWLAMLRIDISGIAPYTLADSFSDRGQGLVRRYPKAGDPIPQAELLVWDMRQLDRGVIPPAKLIAKSTAQDERIITGVWWNPNNLQLLYSISDRLQTWREVRAVGMLFLNGERQTANLMLREESPAWIEPPEAPGWLPDGSFVWRSELPTGRTRLYRISAEAKFITPLTPADFDVRDFRLDPRGEFMIVTGDQQNGTLERKAYRVDLQRAQQPATLVPLTKETGWHAIQVSPDARWMVDRFSTEAKPPVLWLRSTLNDYARRLAESPDPLGAKVRDPKVFHIQAADGMQLPAMLIRPEGESRVPVVIEVYGGPQSPLVARRWAGTKSLYRELLARRGIATLLIDNRSSAGRGLADTWPIRERVGELEFADVMSAVHWLKSQSWVDGERLAIRGWSFGGFLTLYAMTHSNEFAIGIAGGSVTDWAEYDAFYTERYMGLPDENIDGYRATAPVGLADQLQGEVMLIHGESDDNVHPSNTLRMAAALQKAGKPFRMMIYPGAAHAIRDPHQAWHLAEMTDRFLVEELAKDPNVVQKTGK